MVLPPPLAVPLLTVGPKRYAPMCAGWWPTVLQDSRTKPVTSKYYFKQRPLKALILRHRLRSRMSPTQRAAGGCLLLLSGYCVGYCDGALGHARARVI